MIRLLIFCFRTADECGESRHPQKVMKALGITYQIAVPQSINDSWEFWNCENVPDKLPAYIEARNDADPMKHTGWGLSQQDAELLVKNFVS